MAISVSAPVVSSVTLDKSSYAPGDPITATVAYVPGVSEAPGDTYTGTATATDSAGHTANITLSFSLPGGNSNDASSIAVLDSGGITWAKSSDSGTVAVFSATAGSTAGTYAVTATVTDSVTSQSATGTASFSVASAVTPPPPSNGNLPSGVTLRQIDGGPAYYKDNGFTYAASPDSVMTAAGARSWDDPDFFPIGSFFGFYPENSISEFKQLGMNYTENCTSNTDMSVLHRNGIYAILQGNNGSGNLMPGTFGPETVGFHIEEPNSWNEPGDATSITAQVTSCPNLPGRFIHTALTSSQINYPAWNSKPYGDAPGNGTIQDVFGNEIPGTSSRLNLPCMDQYMFADQSIPSAQQNILAIETGDFSAATPDQCARGSNYGDITDLLREWVNGTQGSAPAPVIGPYIENDDALLASQGAHVIKPDEMNWAVWSTLVHGARGVIYFSTPSDDGTQQHFGFATTPQAGQTVSNHAQAVSTNGLVGSMARILNSEFALGYVSATPAAYSFPNALVTMTGTRNGLVSGIDVMAKAYQGPSYTAGGKTFGEGFYVFATYRGSETASNINATFTVAGGYSGPVTVINADGGNASYGTESTLTATNGKFSDTFAKASSVRIYHIPFIF